MKDQKGNYGKSGLISVIIILLLAGGVLLFSQGPGQAFAMMGGGGMGRGMGSGMGSGNMGSGQGGWGRGFDFPSRWSNRSNGEDSFRLRYEIEQKRHELNDVLNEKESDIDRARSIQNQINDLEEQLSRSHSDQSGNRLNLPIPGRLR